MPYRELFLDAQNALTVDNIENEVAIFADARRELDEIQRTGRCNNAALMFSFDGDHANPKAIFLLSILGTERDGEDELNNAKALLTAGWSAECKALLPRIKEFGMQINAMRSNEQGAPDLSQLQRNAGDILGMRWPAEVLNFRPQHGGAGGPGGGRRDRDDTIVLDENPPATPQRTWRQRAEVGSVGYARFMDKAYDKAEELLQTRVRTIAVQNGPRGGDELRSAPEPTAAQLRTARQKITLEETIDANLYGVFQVVKENYNSKKARNVQNLTDGFVTGLVRSAKDMMMARLDLASDGTRIPFLESAFSNADLEPSLQRIAAKYGSDFSVAADNGGAVVFDHAGKLHTGIGLYGGIYNNSADDSRKKNAMHDLILSKKIYIEMLEVYAKHCKAHPNGTVGAADHNYDNVKNHIDECKMQVAVLELVCSESRGHRQRLAGAAVGAITTWVVSAGITTGLAFASDAKVAEVALDALKDAVTGQFDKLAQGLAAHNPILLATVIGACFGLVMMTVGVLSATEVAANINDRPTAIKKFEAMAEEAITNQNLGLEMTRL